MSGLAGKTGIIVCASLIAITLILVVGVWTLSLRRVITAQNSQPIRIARALLQYGLPIFGM